MILNCDIGERGADHPVDRALMSSIGLANIACGGHAGDLTSIRAFRALADDLGVRVAAHLSYPDRENFGRISLGLCGEELLQALDVQAERFGVFDRVKFHGALYNDTVRNQDLAQICAEWLVDRRVGEVVCPAGSELAEAAAKAGLQILKEAFADRRYQRSETGRLELVPRSHPQAVYATVREVLEQVENLITRGKVTTLEGETASIKADTICIHSDSPTALESAQAVAQLLEGTR